MRIREMEKKELTGDQIRFIMIIEIAKIEFPTVI